MGSIFRCHACGFKQDAARTRCADCSYALHDTRLTDDEKHLSVCAKRLRASLERSHELRNEETQNLRKQLEEAQRDLASFHTAFSIHTVMINCLSARLDAYKQANAILRESLAERGGVQ